MRVVAAVVATVAVALVLATARDDAGATVDSGEYLAVADSLRAGDGFTMPYVSYDEPYPDEVRLGQRTPMTQFPPLYPASIAAVGAVTGWSSLTAALAVNVVSLAVTAALVTLLVGRSTRSVAWAALAGALVVAPAYVFTAAMVWSETLMLATFTGALVALDAHLRDGRRRWLAAAVGLGALSSAVRFPGLVAVLATAVVVVRASPGHRRLGRALAVLGVGGLPQAIWFARNTFLIGAPSEKPLGWHPPGWDAAVARVARTVTSWVIRDTPDRRLVVGAVAATGVAWGVATAVRRLRRREVEWSSLPVVCAVFGAVFAAFLVGARTVLDNNVVFSTRQLAAIHVVLVVGGLTAAARHPARARRIAVAGLCLAVVATGTFRLATKTVRVFPVTYRSGYTSLAWDRSEGLAHIRALPADTVVVTNAPDAVWLRTGRAPLFLPLAADLYAGGSNERYDDQLRSLADAVAGHDTVVVFFHRPTRRQVRALDPRVAETLDLDDGRVLADATVYGASTRAAPAR